MRAIDQRAANEVSIKVRATDIVWDTDNDDGYEADWLEPTVEFDLTLPSDHTDEDLLSAIEDELSDGFGFLVLEYEFQILSKGE